MKELWKNTLFLNNHIFLYVYIEILLYVIYHRIQIESNNFEINLKYNTCIYIVILSDLGLYGKNKICVVHRNRYIRHINISPYRLHENYNDA